MRKITKESDDLESRSLEKTIKNLLDFEECMEENKWKPNYTTYTTGTSYYEDDDIETIYVEASWYVPREYDEDTAKKIVRNAFAQLLKQKNEE